MKGSREEEIQLDVLRIQLRDRTDRFRQPQCTDELCFAYAGFGDCHLLRIFGRVVVRAAYLFRPHYHDRKRSAARVHFSSLSLSELRFLPQ